ncbi:betaine/proline/choline family ABC transporter ATP-binding protein [Paenibacillus naphthalenovorans]|uniref:betaine/proline/choline family ABC transporter ATP-binding protein n=1 Tax=Paenibacillus naphthalenovorans TaxID=162209 RepID=UPI003D285FFA
MIRFDNVNKRYGDIHALKDISFQVAKAELVSLIGPSGCGKTTMLRMINRLIEASSGTIYVQGRDISKVDPVELRRSIGYVIQQIGLLPHLTIGKNIGLVPKLKGMKESQYAARIDELLDIVGLDSKVFRNRYPSELSGGQQQRIGVIRALAAEPPIVLMDEPFSALDPISREQLQDELVRLQKSIHKTIVFVTHDMDEALKISDRIAIMNQGEIVQFDTPEAILRQPANDFVRGFIGEKRLAAAKKSAETVLDVMVSQSSTLTPEHRIKDALAVAEASSLDAVLVTDKDDRLVGYVPAADLRSHTGVGERPLGEMTKRGMPQIEYSSHWNEAAKLIVDSDGRAVAVMRNGKPLGLVTERSILRQMLRERASADA